MASLLSLFDTEPTAEFRETLVPNQPNRNYLHGYYVSGPCGGGKTYLTCQSIADGVQSCENTLFVLPTLKLVAEVKQELERLGVPVTVISNETHRENVRETIMNLFASTPDVGAVVIITWSAYCLIPYLARRDEWTIFIDEVPRLDTSFPFKLPRNSSILLEHLEFHDSAFLGLQEVRPRYRNSLKKLMEADRDQIDDTFRPLFQHLTSPNHTVFIEKGWEASLQRPEGEVTFVAVLNEKLFTNAVLMGANIERSLLFQWLTQQYDIHWQPHRLTSRLRYQKHAFGDRVRIHHFNVDRHISQTFKNKKTNDGRRYVDLMDAAAVTFFADKPFLYMRNKDKYWKSKAIEACPTASGLPAVSNGLNEFAGHTRLYISAALNREPAVARVLALLGFDRDAQCRATAHEIHYQAAMRLALRNPASTDPVDVIVPDAIAAGALADALGAIRPSEIVVPEFVRLEPLTQTQKKRRQQAFKAYRKILSAKRIPKSFNIYRNGILFGDNFSARLMATFHKNTHDEFADQFLEKTLSIQDFIQIMRSSAAAPLAAKERGLLFNSTVFKRTSNRGIRRQENFDKSFFLVLDFDDAKITPNDFIRHFGRKAPINDRLPFLIFNSFRRSPAMPNRFKVIIFYQCPATSVEEHQAAFDYIQWRLEEAGWGDKTVGLDRGCRSGNQSFYMPCTNRHHPDWAIFEAHNTRTDEIKQLGLIPFMLPKEEDTPVKAVAGQCASSNQFPRDLIDKTTRTVRSMTCGRHREFFMTGYRLTRLRHNGLRLDRFDVQQELDAIAGSELKMKKKVKGIMQALDRYRCFVL